MGPSCVTARFPNTWPNSANQWARSCLDYLGLFGSMHHANQLSKNSLEYRVIWHVTTLQTERDKCKGFFTTVLKMWSQFSSDYCNRNVYNFWFWVKYVYRTEQNSLIWTCSNRTAVKRDDLWNYKIADDFSQINLILLSRLAQWFALDKYRPTFYFNNLFFSFHFFSFLFTCLQQLAHRLTVQEKYWRSALISLIQQGLLLF